MLSAFSGVFQSLVSGILVIQPLREKQSAQGQNGTDSLHPSGQSGMVVGECYNLSKVENPDNKKHSAGAKRPTGQTNQHSIHGSDAATLETG